MLRVGQLDLRKIYNPEMGRLDIRAAANEFGWALPGGNGP
jgi:hypothetical protein